MLAFFSFTSKFNYIGYILDYRNHLLTKYWHILLKNYMSSVLKAVSLKIGRLKSLHYLYQKIRINKNFFIMVL